MKKTILLFLMPLLFIMASDAQAQECCDETNFYAKIFSGANFLQNTSIDSNTSTYRPGYIVAGSLGFCWNYGLRLEAEYAFRRNAIRKMHFFIEDSTKHGHFQASSFMTNLLWDLPLSNFGFACWDIKPFIGFGLGYDFQKVHSSNCRIVFNERWNQFSWQAMTGFCYPIFCNTKVTLEYRFHAARSHFYSHSVGIGLIHKLGFLR